MAVTIPMSGIFPPAPVRKAMPVMDTTIAATWSLVNPSLNTVPITMHTTVGYRKFSMMAVPTGRYR